MQYLDLRLTLPEYLNHSADRATMAYGLEARVPFLDHELVDFCSRVPLGLKMRGMYEKYLFRKAMEDVLPQEVAHRRKHGLSAPYERWWRNKNLPAFAEDALTPEQLRATGYFHPGFVQNLIGRHRRREGSFGTHLTTVLAVQLREKMLSRAALNSGHPAVPASAPAMAS
jgi:asparagine synthase (glutamine-hydrolysing)